MTTTIGRPRVSDEMIMGRVVTVLAEANGRYLTGSQLRRRVRGEAVRIDEAVARLIALGVVRHGSRHGRFLLDDTPETRALLAGLAVRENRSGAQWP
jgi:hypothetical protein